MKITFEVTDNGVKHQVVAGQADLIAMERKYNVGISALQDAPRIEYVAFVAWNAARRQGITSLDFDAWIEQAEFDQVGDQGNP